jgi:hypothetical protein
MVVVSLRASLEPLRSRDSLPIFDAHRMFNGRDAVSFRDFYTLTVV